MKKKMVITTTTLAFLLGCILLYQNITYNNKKLHIVVCDVGQGDAIFARTPQGSDILIDGGPDDSVLSCLTKHMPFWDKELELMMLSHPHSDHFMGFFSVLKNYKVKFFASENLSSKTAGFSSLMDKIKAQKIPMRFVFAGDKFKLKDGVRFEIVGPTEEFLRETSPGGTIGESSEFASLETLIKYKNFSALLTGDSQVSELEQAINDKRSFGFDWGGQAISNLSILQVPHHGSRFGLTAEILDVLDPKLAAISVGKNNKYGHPAPSILAILKDKNIKILRTDQNGEVEIVSDGNKFQTKN